MKLTTRNATQNKRMYIQIDLFLSCFLNFVGTNTKGWVHTKTSGTDQFLLYSPQKLTIQKLILQCFSFCLPRFPSLHLERGKKKMENTTKARYVKHQSSFSINKNIFILNHSPQERFVKVHTFAQLSQSSHLLDFLHNFPPPFEPILNWFIFVHL